MAVLRIVPNIRADSVQDAAAFYRDMIGLEPVMDLGWIVTFAGPGPAAPQINILSDGGSGQPVPDISIEVDDLDETHARAVAAGFVIEYGPVEEPWGVRRFFVRDPFGRLINVLAHDG